MNAFSENIHKPSDNLGSLDGHEALLASHYKDIRWHLQASRLRYLSCGQKDRGTVKRRKLERESCATGFSKLEQLSRSLALFTTHVLNSLETIPIILGRREGFEGGRGVLIQTSFLSTSCLYPVDA